MKAVMIGRTVILVLYTRAAGCGPRLEPAEHARTKEMKQ